LLANCLYPEPAQSKPYNHIPLSEDPSKYYPHIYAWVSPMVSFPQVSPPKPRTDGRIILKEIFKKWCGGHGLKLSGSRYGQEVGCCECGDETFEFHEMR
jgi:hypothetical protein